MIIIIRHNCKTRFFVASTKVMIGIWASCNRSAPELKCKHHEFGASVPLGVVPDVSP
jgi:hypothetical protein